MSSPSIEGCDVIDEIIQKESLNEKFSSPYDNEQVLYIDEDDERSVSLKSSISDSKTSSYTISNKKNRSQTFSISSSSSSSSSLSLSNFSNRFYKNQIKRLESSV
jgi:hypothetical protein